MTVDEAHPDRRSVSRPPDDELGLLFRSLKDEREFVLIPRLKRLEEALRQILDLSENSTRSAKLRRLVEIHQVAEAALSL